MPITHRAPINDQLAATVYLVKGAFAELRKNPKRLQELEDLHEGEDGLLVHLCWFAELAIPWHNCSRFDDLDALQGYTTDYWFDFCEKELGGCAGRWLLNFDQLPLTPTTVYASRLEHLKEEARRDKEAEERREKANAQVGKT